MNVLKSGKSIFLSFATAFLLTACGGGSSSTNKEVDNTVTDIETNLTAYYMDSPVSGVSVKDSEGNEIKTDKDGKFTAKSGVVSMYIGNYLINKYNLEENEEYIFESSDLMKQLLQSLDSDGDPTNGISILQEVVDYFKNHNVTVSSEDDIKNLVDAINSELGLNLQFVDYSTALENFNKYLEKLMADIFMNKDFYVVRYDSDLQTYLIDKMHTYYNPDPQGEWDKYKCDVCYNYDGSECKGGEKTGFEMYLGASGGTPWISASTNGGEFYHEFRNLTGSGDTYEADDGDKIWEEVEKELEGEADNLPPTDITYTQDYEKAKNIQQQCISLIKKHKTLNVKKISFIKVMKFRIWRLSSGALNETLKKIKNITFVKMKDSYDVAVRVTLENGKTYSKTVNLNEDGKYYTYGTRSDQTIEIEGNSYHFEIVIDSEENTPYVSVEISDSNIVNNVDDTTKIDAVVKYN
ncbi:hypothetical protein [Nautilia sp.]